MAISNLSYWYDSQMKRFLAQVVSAFSGYQYQPGVRNGVQQPLATVPCRMAITNQLVGNILRNQSENTLLAVPMITVFQTGLAGRRDDVQYPGFTDKIQVTERAISGAAYTGKQGNRYTVERMMGRPFEMSIQVDIWTSNLDQKHQLAEQILTVIFPTFDIQNSTNALDWSALSMIRLEDIIWSSRSIPIGSSSEIDIMTINLKLPFWLNPPVKVTQQKIIQQIVVNVLQGDAGDTDDYLGGALLARDIVTPDNLHIKVSNGTITALNSRDGLEDADGEVYDWAKILLPYGTLKPAVSEIRLLTTTEPDGPYVSGIISLVAGASNELNWQVDPTMLPANTLDPIDAMVDPLNVVPGRTQPAPTAGTRYLITNDISPSLAWPLLTAKKNDIIVYENDQWSVVFEAANVLTPEVLLNRYNGRQLRWTGKEWVLTIDGFYPQGLWQIAL